MSRSRRNNNSSTSSSNSSAAVSESIVAEGSAVSEIINLTTMISDTSTSEAQRTQMRLLATKLDEETWFLSTQTVGEWRITFESIPSRKWAMIKHVFNKDWYQPFYVSNVYDFLKSFDDMDTMSMSPFVALDPRSPRGAPALAAPSLTVATTKTKALARAGNTAIEVAETLLGLGRQELNELENFMSHQKLVHTEMETDVITPGSLSTMNYSVPAEHNALQQRFNDKIKAGHANVRQALSVGDSQAVNQHLSKLEILQKTAKLALRAQFHVSKFYQLLCDRYSVLQVHPERHRRLPPGTIYRLLTNFATALASKFNYGGETPKPLVFEDKPGTLANITRAILFIHEVHGFTSFFTEWVKFAQGEVYSASVLKNLANYQTWWIRIKNPVHPTKSRGSRGQNNRSRGDNSGKRKSSSSSSSSAATKSKTKKPRPTSDGSGTPTSTTWVTN